MAYSLEYGRTDTASIRQELAALLQGEDTKLDCARLLAVMSGIAARGADAIEENIHTRVGERALHSVGLTHGMCAFYYAYGVKLLGTIYLLWCGLDSQRLLNFPLAAYRLPGAH